VPGWLTAGFTVIAALGDPVELHWHAPPSCPGETDVAAQIAARIEPRVAPSGATDRVVADIVITRGHETHVAELVITTGAGRTERRLEAASCATVADAAVLIVAMIHAQSQDTAIEIPPAPAAVEPTDPPPRPAPVEASPVPTRPRTPRLRGGAFAEIAVGFAGLPGIGPGLGGGLALLGERFRVEVLGAYWFARDASIGVDGGGARVDVRLWTVGAHAGPVLHAGPVELALLAGAHAGLAHGEGDRLPIPRSALRTWVSVGAYPAVLWPLHPRVAIGLRGTIEGVAVRPRFAVRDGGTRFTATPVTGALAAVIEVRFP
jgi:hypothetical protein